MHTGQSHPIKGYSNRGRIGWQLVQIISSFLNQCIFSPQFEIFIQCSNTELLPFSFNLAFFTDIHLIHPDRSEKTSSNGKVQTPIIRPSAGKSARKFYNYTKQNQKLQHFHTNQSHINQTKKKERKKVSFLSWNPNEPWQEAWDKYHRISELFASSSCSCHRPPDLYPAIRESENFWIRSLRNPKTLQRRWTKRRKIEVPSPPP